MIAFVRGTVAGVTLTSAVLEVGGVGLELMCAPGTLATLRTGHQATLPTSMVVREDSLTLFGFLDDDEKSCFELLQTASGVVVTVARQWVVGLVDDADREAGAADETGDAEGAPAEGSAPAVESGTAEEPANPADTEAPSTHKEQ